MALTRRVIRRRLALIVGSIKDLGRELSDLAEHGPLPSKQDLMFMQLGRLSADAELRGIVLDLHLRLEAAASVVERLKRPASQRLNYPDSEAERLLGLLWDEAEQSVGSE